MVVWEVVENAHPYLKTQIERYVGEIEKTVKSIRDRSRIGNSLFLHRIDLDVNVLSVRFDLYAKL